MYKSPPTTPAPVRCYCCDLMKCYGRPPAITFPLHRLTLHLYGSIPRDGISFLFHDPSGDGFYETFGDSPRKIWLRSSLPPFKGCSFVDDLAIFQSFRDTSFNQISIQISSTLRRYGSRIVVRNADSNCNSNSRLHLRKDRRDQIRTKIIVVIVIKCRQPHQRQPVDAHRQFLHHAGKRHPDRIRLSYRRPRRTRVWV